MNNNFFEIVEKFKNIHVLVMGDAMLDNYLYGISQRICREAPVPVVDIQSQNYTGGGAANAAINAAMLGASVKFLSIIGNDSEGRLLLQTLQSANIHTDNLIIDSKRKTLSKTRICANGQLLLRCDDGTTHEIRQTIEDRLINRLVDTFPNVDAVILSDYGYGVITQKILTTLEKLQHAVPKVIVVDSKYLERYAFISPTIVKPNYQETLKLLGRHYNMQLRHRPSDVLEWKDKLFTKTHAHIIAVTLDSDGSLVFDKNGNIHQTHTSPVDNSKASGAGDTYTAAFTLAFLASGSAVIAAEIASHACEIILHKDGTAYTSQQELLQAFSESRKLITSIEELDTITNSCKMRNKKIVFSNGCFDILHNGHVSYLQKAKRLGDILIVGVNTDESVRRLKGQNRPINTLMDRVQVLSGLSSIDYIIPFGEDTPIDLIQHIHPDIYVKGGDYTRESLPEAPIIEAQGGRIEIIPLIIDKSTTNIIRKITSRVSSEV